MNDNDTTKFLQFLEQHLTDTIRVRMEYTPKAPNKIGCPGHTLVVKATIVPEHTALWMGELLKFDVVDFKAADIKESGCTCYENRGWFFHNWSKDGGNAVFNLLIEGAPPRTWNNRQSTGFSLVDSAWNWSHRSYVEVQLG